MPKFEKNAKIMQTCVKIWKICKYMQGKMQIYVKFCKFGIHLALFLAIPARPITMGSRKLIIACKHICVRPVRATPWPAHASSPSACLPPAMRVLLLSRLERLLHNACLISVTIAINQTLHVQNWRSVLNPGLLLPVFVATCTHYCISER